MCVDHLSVVSEMEIMAVSCSYHPVLATATETELSRRLAWAWLRSPSVPSSNMTRTNSCTPYHRDMWCATEGKSNATSIISRMAGAHLSSEVGKEERRVPDTSREITSLRPAYSILSTLRCCFWGGIECQPCSSIRARPHWRNTCSISEIKLQERKVTRLTQVHKLDLDKFLVFVPIS